MEEIWKDIEGYEGAYQISSFGRVKSCARIVKGGLGLRRTKEKILKPINTNGYQYVQLHDKEGKVQSVAIHRLVVMAFIPNPENKPEVGHKDESRNNNHVDNLEWVTKEENAKTPLRRQRLSESRKNIIITEESRRRMGESHKGGKSSTAKQVVCEGKMFECAGYCADFYNIKSRTMRRWLDGSRTMPERFKQMGLHYYKTKEEEND